MADTILLKCTVARPKRTRWLIGFGVIAVIAAVCTGVNLWMGERELPPELVGSTPYFVAATAIFSIAAVIAGMRAAASMRIVERGGSHALIIVERERTIEVALPTRFACAWHMGFRMVGRSLRRAPEVQLAVFDGERVAIYVREELSHLRGGPTEVPQAIVRVGDGGARGELPRAVVHAGGDQPLRPLRHPPGVVPTRIAAQHFTNPFGRIGLTGFAAKLRALGCEHADDLLVAPPP